MSRCTSVSGAGRCALRVPARGRRSSPRSFRSRSPGRRAGSRSTVAGPPDATPAVDVHATRSCASRIAVDDAVVAVGRRRHPCRGSGTRRGRRSSRRAARGARQRCSAYGSSPSSGVGEVDERADRRGRRAGRPCSATPGVVVCPGYSPASTAPGSTHQAWRNVDRAASRRSTVAAAGGRTGGRRSPRCGRRRRSARATRRGIPDQPQRAPASWPAIAAVVSASSPRLAARSTASRKSVGAADGPQRRFERVDAVAGAADRGRLLAAPRAAGDRFDLRVEVGPTARSSARAPRRPACPGSARRSSRPAPGRRRRAASPDASCGSTRRSARRPRPCRCASGSARPASRISEPLAAASSSGCGSTISPVRSNRDSARLVVIPMSKHAPGRRPVAVAVPDARIGELVGRIEFDRCRGSTRPGTSPSTCHRSTHRPGAGTARRRPCR